MAPSEAGVGISEVLGQGKNRAQHPLILSVSALIIQNWQTNFSHLLRLMIDDIFLGSVENGALSGHLTRAGLTYASKYRKSTAKA